MDIHYMEHFTELNSVFLWCISKYSTEIRTVAYSYNSIMLHIAIIISLITVHH